MSQAGLSRYVIRAIKLGAVGLLAAAFLPLGASVATSAASADVPDVPIGLAFNAPECSGAVAADPTHALGPVSDLTLVFGQRLADYNAGKIVVLYDAFGENDDDGYPALCGVRYVAGVGPVSQWMFCTDIFSHICSGTDSEGQLLDIDGKPIGGLAALDGNSKLSADQNKLIAYLILNGHAYDGSGYYSWDGVGDGAADATVDERLALQTLIWCISDPADPASPKPSEVQRAATCQASMNPDEQARLLTLIPDAPSVQLAFTGSTATLRTGDTARFTLTTNLHDQPITLAESGLTGDLTVVAGDATLAGNLLTVVGDDPEQTSTVTLGFTASTAGTEELTVSAQPASVTELDWNQSPGVAADTKKCQVFANFNQVNPPEIVDHADAIFAAAVSSSPGTSGPGTSGPSTSGPSSSESSSAGSSGTVPVPVSASALASTTAVSAGSELANTGLEPEPVIMIAFGLLGIGALLLVVEALLAASLRDAEVNTSL